MAPGPALGVSVSKRGVPAVSMSASGHVSLVSCRRLILSRSSSFRHSFMEHAIIASSVLKPWFVKNGELYMCRRMYVSYC